MSYAQYYKKEELKHMTHEIPGPTLLFAALNDARNKLILALDLSMGIDACFNVDGKIESIKEQCEDVLGTVWNRLHKMEGK